MYVCINVFYFQKHIHISHCNNKQHEQSMCSEGQTGVKHLRLPLKHIKHIQVAQLSQRDRAAGWVSNGQKWKTGTERQYLRTI